MNAVSKETRIERVEVYGYDVNYAHGTYIMSGDRRITSLPSTIVRVITTAGAEGFGEVCPLGPAYLPAFGGGARAAMELLGPAVIGQDVADHSGLNARMDDALMGHGYAKSAVDIASWDALGRHSGLSVAALLGGERQTRFPLYYAVPLGPVDEMAAYVEDRRSEGIHNFQLKLGDDPRQDAERVRVVAERASEGDTIVADANCGWRSQDAVIAARLLEDLDHVLYEQPCPTIEECLLVRERTTLPMVLDEVIVDVAALLRAHAANAMEQINLKIGRVGGLTKAKQIRDLCETLGLRMTIEDTWGGDVTTAAVAHLAGSTAPEAFFAASFMNDWVLERVAGHQPHSNNGYGVLPKGSGLGIEVDLSLLGAPIFTFV
ncbi:mandelate racemase/muconate lactonizing enzyme family protein [Streptomyces prunicolor]|uniref:mandelate racemase/muconate lactonizing enzyme family protein n=1 Tax=Streptomyces prunicolor TaxID=67348 RepID=UPI0037D5A0A6